MRIKHRAWTTPPPDHSKDQCMCTATHTHTHTHVLHILYVYNNIQRPQGDSASFMRPGKKQRVKEKELCHVMYSITSTLYSVRRYLTSGYRNPIYKGFLIYLSIVRLFGSTKWCWRHKRMDNHPSVAHILYIHKYSSHCMYIVFILCSTFG